MSGYEKVYERDTGPDLTGSGRYLGVVRHCADTGGWWVEDRWGHVGSWCAHREDAIASLRGTFSLRGIAA